MPRGDHGVTPTPTVAQSPAFFTLIRKGLTPYHMSDSVRLDTRRSNNTSLLHPERKQNNRRRREKTKECRAIISNTKEALGVPTSLNNFPTTAVAPYWINQRLQSNTYNQTPSLHRNEGHRCTSCAVSSNNS